MSEHATFGRFQALARGLMTGWREDQRRYCAIDLGAQNTASCPAGQRQHAVLTRLTKAVLKTALNQELTEQLGDEKHGHPVAGRCAMAPGPRRC